MDSTNITALIFLLIVILAFLYEYRQFLKSRGEQPIYSNSTDRDHIRQILENKFSYFRKLNHNEQIRFIKRVFTFMNLKQWIGADNLKITDEIKTLVSASAIQLTFGMKYFILSHFETITIHPGIYIYEPTHQKFKGAVSPRGTIDLSWTDFKEGYKNPYDKVNLGLHEMAHALDITSLMSDNEYLENLFARVRNNFRDEYRDMVNHHLSFFRSYGATNQKEFFAVLVETFFESPIKFKENLPELYGDMCYLLNQDPVNNIYRNYIGTIDKTRANCLDNNLNTINIIEKLSITPYKLITRTFKYTFWVVLVLGGLFLTWFSPEQCLLIGLGVFTLIGTSIYLNHPTIYYGKEALIFRNKMDLNICIDFFDIVSIVYFQNYMLVYYFRGSNFTKMKIKTLSNDKKIKLFLREMAGKPILVRTKKVSAINYSF